jgi:Predicted nucleotide-binding protein containing TIR-like domain/Histidine-specific methyltransferase, SAM-dependent
VKRPGLKNKKVFVVHGRNLRARDAMFSFLRALKLQPIEWAQAVQPTGMATPTTLASIKAGIAEAHCTVVLLTGDDLAILRPELGDEELPLHQPRPNVLFEAGYALAVAGQERTLLVKSGALREISDISGLNFINIDNTAPKRQELLQRLKDAGCEPDDTGNDFLRKEIADFEAFDYEEDSPDILSRGGFTDFLVDSSLSHSLNDLQLQIELDNYLAGNGSASLKYNYLGAVGAQNWLDLSGDPTYGHSELHQAFIGNAEEIVKASGLGGQPVDFVSLGPGDGKIDIQLLQALKHEAILRYYYPLDCSLELLQTAVTAVINTKHLWRNKSFKIKAIHGEFTRLGDCRPIFGYHNIPNFFSLIGYSFGNYNEAQLLGTLRAGMEPNDLLLVDARLHGGISEKPTNNERLEIAANYKHRPNNRFAFGHVERATYAEFRSTSFLYDVNMSVTSVPGAINVVTYCVDINTRFRRTNKKLSRKRFDLAVTTLYDGEKLKSWLYTKGFELLWSHRDKSTIFCLLRKPAS